MIIFWFKEAFKSIGRAKSSFVLTFISLTLAVILIEASLIAVQLSEIFQKRLKTNISLHIFLKDPIDNNKVNNYKNELNNKDFILSVKFISKDEAAKSFINETGEDFREILDYNPLPASFVVKLNTDSLQKAMDELSGYKWVDEVVFRNKFIYRLIGYLDSGKKYLFAVTGLLILIAIYLVYSTIRLITNARMRELETMKLVGAKLSTIKMPILLNGLITGILASLFSIAVYYFISVQLSHYQSINNFVFRYRYYYLASLIFLGPFLSFIVTLFSLRKLTLKI